VIAEMFSRTPGARYRTDGPFSGEQFRDEILEPRFVEAQRTGVGLTIVLDGTTGYATSFLEEAFGGLARKYGPAEVAKMIAFLSNDDPDLPVEIREYVTQANRG